MNSRADMAQGGESAGAPQGAATNPSSPNTALVLRDVRFGYETSRPIIRDLSTTLVPGRLCAMIGPNAAGKTTLLKLMLGQLTPWSGACLLMGREVSAVPAGRRAAALSYVPQHSAVNFAFTVEQVTAMGRFALPRDDGSVDDALRRCDLTAIRREIYSELSAGQQQRVMLARAMAQSQPQGKVMLLDEPVSHMDLRHAHQTLSMLQDVARQGLAVLVVLHDLNLASRWADEIWLLHQGRLLARGPVSRVMTPAVLGPVYGVKLAAATPPPPAAPMLFVDSIDSSPERV